MKIDRWTALAVVGLAVAMFFAACNLSPEQRVERDRQLDVSVPIVIETLEGLDIVGLDEEQREGVAEAVDLLSGMNDAIADAQTPAGPNYLAIFGTVLGSVGAAVGAVQKIRGSSKPMDKTTAGTLKVLGDNLSDEQAKRLVALVDGTSTPENLKG